VDGRTAADRHEQGGPARTRRGLCQTEQRLAGRFDRAASVDQRPHDTGLCAVVGHPADARQDGEAGDEQQRPERRAYQRAPLTAGRQGDGEGRRDQLRLPRGR
jgi:hypothetical protein